MPEITAILSRKEIEDAILEQYRWKYESAFALETKLNNWRVKFIQGKTPDYVIAELTYIPGRSVSEGGDKE